MHDEGGALARRALDAQASAMPVKHMLDQRQAQSRAALRAAVDDVDPVETLGQPRQMLTRDTGTVVADSDGGLGQPAADLAARQRDIYPLAGGTIFERVLDQVLEHADQFVAVPQYGQGTRR